MKRTESLIRVMGWNPTGDFGPWTFYTAKNQAVVFFQKSPPLAPPSPLQIHQRNKFRLVALSWQALPEKDKENWRQLAKRARVDVTHYDLFVYYCLTHDAASIRTLERQSGVTVLPLFHAV